MSYIYIYMYMSRLASSPPSQLIVGEGGFCASAVISYHIRSYHIIPDHIILYQFRLYYVILVCIIVDPSIAYRIIV